VLAGVVGAVSDPDDADDAGVLVSAGDLLRMDLERTAAFVQTPDRRAGTPDHLADERAGLAEGWLDQASVVIRRLPSLGCDDARLAAGDVRDMTDEARRLVEDDDAGGLLGRWRSIHRGAGDLAFEAEQLAAAACD
jgi:hypothetical protein